MYKPMDQMKYKTTTIRIREEHYNILKDAARKDHRSTNYIIAKIITEYINRELIEFEFDLS